MINDNFNFKKLLKESIREREGSIESLGERESFKPPEKSDDESKSGTKFSYDRPPEAKEADERIEGFKSVEPFQSDGKPNKFYDKVVELWDKLKGDADTEARVISTMNSQVKTYLENAVEAEKDGRDRDHKRQKGDKQKEDRGETASETPEEPAAAEEPVSDAAPPPTLSALLLEPVNPEDKSKGFKSKEHEPGSMASRINIALNNLSDPALKSNYIGFKKKPNAANRKSFMSNLSNLKKALDGAGVKIEGAERKRKEAAISELTALFERHTA